MSTKFKDGLTSGGTLIAKSDITLGDHSASGGPNGESQGSIVFGAGNDFRITTSGDSGVIRQQTAAKPLYLQPADSNSILITKSGTPANKIAEFTEAGAVDLYHNTALKFKTELYGAGVVNQLLIGSNQGGSVTNNLPALAAETSVTTSTVTADSQYQITAVGSKSNWSQIGGPEVATVGAIFSTAASHIATNMLDAGKSNTNTLTQGINGATINGVTLTPFPANCKVKKLNAAKLNFAAHSNDQAFITSLQANNSQSIMRFNLTDDLHGTLPTMAATLNLNSHTGERFEFTANDHPTYRTFAAATIVPLWQGNRNPGCELILAGTSKVTATYFKGEAETVSSISAFDTDSLSEGTGNLYHTTARVQSAISLTTNSASGSGALTYNNGAFAFTPPNLSSFLTSTSVPEATGSAFGGIKTGFTSTGRNYAVQLSSGVAYVNVPWVDTNTNTFRGITGTPSATSTDAVSVSAKWAYTNVKKAVPENANFSNTTYGAAGGATNTSNNGIYLDGTTFKLTKSLRYHSQQDIGNNSNTYTRYNESDYISFYCAGGTNGTERMRLEKDGDLHVDGDITAFSSTVSDERLKSNILIVDNALDKVSQLNGVTFNWKKDNSASAGLIAQDLEKVLPSAIKEKQLPFKSDDEEVYKTVEYSQVTALLVEAIKELKEQNELMKAEIEELKANK